MGGAGSDGTMRRKRGVAIQVDECARDALNNEVSGGIMGIRIESKFNKGIGLLEWGSVCLMDV